jgi:hypothetical protein
LESGADHGWDIAADGAQDAGADDEKLSGVLDANPELRDAWHDAKAYREVFATPAEVRAARKPLGDLNRMDALFFFAAPGRPRGTNAPGGATRSAIVRVARAGHVCVDGGGPAKMVTQEIPGSSRPSAGKSDPRQPEAANSNESRTGNSSTTAGLVGPTPAQSDFFHSTNAAAVQGVTGRD